MTQEGYAVYFYHNIFLCIEYFIIIIINFCYPLWNIGHQKNVAIWSYLWPSCVEYLEWHFQKQHDQFACSCVMSVFIESMVQLLIIFPHEECRVIEWHNLPSLA
jgi:hypothetical protein